MTPRPGTWPDGGRGAKPRHWLLDTIAEVLAGHARPVCLWAILCAVIGHDDDPDAIVPGLGQCRRCHLNAPVGDAPRGWVP